MIGRLCTVSCALAALAACGSADSGEGPPGADAPGADAATAGPDAAPPGPATLDGLRDALLSGNPALGEGATACARWDSLDPSRKAVFLTLTHRLFASRTPDGASMLAHMTRLHLILGGGADGAECGGDENNRLFLSMDDYLWDLMVQTFDDAAVIEDGGGETWKRTGDLAGPHDPFDASDETRTGLRCALIFELPESRPPTAQAHFFLDGSAVAIQRGPGIDLPADARMLEIDHDYDCTHDSNPLCDDFEAKYVANYGDFDCRWVPAGCAAVGQECYPPVE